MIGLLNATWLYKSHRSSSHSRCCFRERLFKPGYPTCHTTLPSTEMGWYIEIDYRLATYASGAIILPTEIVLLICGFIRDQPVQRHRCRLVCHQWYNTIDFKDKVVIESTEDINEMIHVTIPRSPSRIAYHCACEGAISPSFAIWNSCVSFGRQHAHIPSSSAVFRTSPEWKHCGSVGAAFTARTISGTYCLP
ncbi:hypothetical protein C8Q72DRAFT_60900 [Fomitopsis betulina]|nr:hypothetical protein C8Q72DRAFT_60900 [Fomitopsis betulina]